jgi:hypothetical protein
MSIEKPVFNQVNHTKLYLLTLPPQADLLKNLQIGFLVLPDAVLDPSLSVEDAWNYAGGVYLYMNGVPADTDAFIAALRAVIAAPAFSDVRFLWVTDVTMTQSPWIGNRIRAKMLPGAPANWSTLATEVFPFADYEWVIGAGCTIQGPSADNGWGFTFIPMNPDDPNIQFVTPLDVYPIASANAVLPLAGLPAGGFQCKLALNHPPAPDVLSDFERLQTGLSYFVPELNPDQPGAVRWLRFPVLIQPSAPLDLFVSLDPLNPLCGDATHLSFFSSSGDPVNLPVMTSYFSTNTGYDVCLKPQKGNSAESDARFVFAPRPLWENPALPPLYYLTLEGGYLISTGSPATEPTAAVQPVSYILCGLSGTEYAGLTSLTGNILHFIPHQNAYAPRYPAVSDDVHNSDDKHPPLTDLGTTSWLFLTAPDSDHRIYYYAQPEPSLLYDAGKVAATNGDSTHLDFLEIPAAVFPPALYDHNPVASNTNQCPMFPMVPFRGIFSGDSDQCRLVEQQAIAPVRRASINEMVGFDAPVDTAPNVRDGPTTGVTPQGLIVGLDDTLLNWQRLCLGTIKQNVENTRERDNIVINDDWLQVTNVRGPFKAAMLSSQLFLVIADQEKFTEQCDFLYRLTEESLRRIRALPADKRGPDSIFRSIQTQSGAAKYPVYNNVTDYKNQLLAWTANAVQPFLKTWIAEGIYFELNISGWKFLISPSHWFDQNRANHNHTIMIMKFNNRALDDLVNDYGAWPWPEAAAIDGSVQKTSQELRAIFDQAKENVENPGNGTDESPYDHFVNDVLLNPQWNGVLFLNCTVPLSELPPQLQGISAGIRKEMLYGHHVGLTITPLSVSGGAVHLGETSLFGLIDYQDKQDLIFNSELAFDFKVLTLCILFENSGIKLFSLFIELLICQLFNETVLLLNAEHGNNLLLQGLWQHNNGEDYYSFRQVSAAQYQLGNSALETVEVLSSAFITLTPESAESENTIVRTNFVLSGNLYFIEFPRFDLFSFGPAAMSSGDSSPVNGYLRYTNFIIAMQFDSADSTGSKQFDAQASAMTFDLSQSLYRTDALYGKFPLTLTGLLESPATNNKDEPPAGRSPKDFGYTAIGMPLEPGLLSYPWYGLTMDLGLGTLGSLAGNLGLKITLLAAWSKSGSGTDPIIWAGMKLPGFNDLGVKLPIEGILSVGFRNILFTASETDKGRLYMLKLRQFGLRLLGLSFPPGNNDIYLFGNPDNRSNTKLGWYAAYSEDKKDQSPSSGAQADRTQGTKGGSV